jgi:CDP-diacylglycerol--glycerol-3-phosphate 3-phosphatidyltransferase
VAAAEVSDLLDGYLARRWKQVSNLGKILDPYADSTFHLTCFFSFATGAQGSWLPVWVVLFLFYREVFVEVLRRMGAEKGIYVAASMSGKMKTFTQASVIVIVLVLALAADLPAGRAAGLDPSLAAGIVPPLSWFAVAVTWLSGADYAWRHRAIFRGSGAPAGGSPS